MLSFVHWLRWIFSHQYLVMTSGRNTYLQVYNTQIIWVHLLVKCINIWFYDRYEKLHVYISNLCFGWDATIFLNYILGLLFPNNSVTRLPWHLHFLPHNLSAQSCQVLEMMASLKSTLLFNFYKKNQIFSNFDKKKWNNCCSKTDQAMKWTYIKRSQQNASIEMKYVI